MAEKARIEAGRWLFFVVGVALNPFGIALIAKGALGTSPISSPPYVLSLRYAPTLGEFTFVMNTLFVAVQAVLLRGDFKLFQVLQMAVNVVFSAFIDVSMGALWWLVPGNIVEGLLVVVAGCAVLGLGVAIEVAPNILMMPGEGIVRAISTVCHKRFGSTKVVFDCTLVAIAVARFVNFCNMHVTLVGYAVNLRIRADELRETKK